MTGKNAGAAIVEGEQVRETCLLDFEPHQLALAVVVAEPPGRFVSFVRQAGLGWTTAWHLLESLDRSSEFAADATIVDIDGSNASKLADTCTKILGSCTGTPLLVFTKYDMPAARADLLALGVSDVLSAQLQEPRELVIRVETAARLFSGRSRPLRTWRYVRFGEVEVELGSECIWLSGRPLPLTVQQRSILLRLAREPEVAVSYEQLYTTADIQPHPAHANLHNQVSRLRKRLGASGRHIVGAPGVGVVLKLTLGTRQSSDEGDIHVTAQRRAACSLMTECAEVART